MCIVLADADQLASLIAPALVVGAIAAVCAGYVGLCVYFTSRAEASTHDATVRSAGEPPPSMPFTWMAPAAVAALLGFTPCALAALVHSSRVALYYRSGNHEAAVASARAARWWFWWSVGIGGVLILLFAVAPLLALSRA